MLLTCCAEKRRGEVLLLTCCAEICNLLVQLFAEIFDFTTRRLTDNFTCVFAHFRLRRSKRQIYGDFNPWRGTSKRQFYRRLCGDIESRRFYGDINGDSLRRLCGDFAEMLTETLTETLNGDFTETLRRSRPTAQTGI